MTAFEQTITEFVEGWKGWLARINDAVFSYGELGMQEVRTTDLLCRKFEENGFRVERGIGKMPTAFLASYGSGKPVIALTTEYDSTPGTSQKPGIPVEDPIVAGAPGHAEGHNNNAAVFLGAALAVKEVMNRHGLQGTVKAIGAPAEEQLVSRPFLVRDGYLDDVDVALSAHLNQFFATSYGRLQYGLISVEFTFHGKTAHASVAPWEGISALDAAQLMNVGFDMMREHLPVTQRTHHVISHGGEQPNVVPARATNWYFLREQDPPAMLKLFETVKRVAQGAALIMGATVEHKIISGVWPSMGNQVLAEVAQQAIEKVGMPSWSVAEQEFACRLQKSIGLKEVGMPSQITPLRKAEQKTSASDVGDVTWKVPHVRIYYPTQPVGVSFHHWGAAVTLATPIAHKGVMAGTRALALTACEVLSRKGLVEQIHRKFEEEKGDVQYSCLIPPEVDPPLELNRTIMEHYRPEMEKFYYDPDSRESYLEQMGITLPF